MDEKTNYGWVAAKSKIINVDIPSIGDNQLLA